MGDGLIYFRDGELIAESGDTRIYKMNGKLFKWEISVWNHLTSQLSGKYRVTDLVK